MTRNNFRKLQLNVNQCKSILVLRLARSPSLELQIRFKESLSQRVEKQAEMEILLRSDHKALLTWRIREKLLTKLLGIVALTLLTQTI